MQIQRLICSWNANIDTIADSDSRVLCFHWLEQSLCYNILDTESISAHTKSHWHHDQRTASQRLVLSCQRDRRCLTTLQQHCDGRSMLPVAWGHQHKICLDQWRNQAPAGSAAADDDVSRSCDEILLSRSGTKPKDKPFLQLDIDRVVFIK